MHDDHPARGKTFVEERKRVSHRFVKVAVQMHKGELSSGNVGGYRSWKQASHIHAGLTMTDDFADHFKRGVCKGDLLFVIHSDQIAAVEAVERVKEKERLSSLRSEVSEDGGGITAVN